MKVWEAFPDRRCGVCGDQLRTLTGLKICDTCEADVYMEDIGDDGMPWTSDEIEFAHAFGRDHGDR